MGNIIFVAASTALASAVEFVEALTIVLAVGYTRGWRAAFEGTAAATVGLGVIVLAVGFGILTRVPDNGLQLVIGALLLVFGLKWLRKAILRYSGLKALHDEEATYREEIERFSSHAATTKRDWVAVSTAFNGVFLEGIEVVFIVVGLGATGKALGAATGGAVVAGILVIGAGIILHRPLKAVPENTMKFVVGIMLTAFGTFWLGEGLGVWKADILILLLVIGYLIASGLMIGWLKNSRPQLQTAA